MADIQIEIVKETDTGAIERLYRDAGWWRDDYTADFIPGMARDSFVFVVALRGTEIIGMGRALSDGVSDAYIQDVAVLSEFRGQGIGSRIIKSIIGRLKEHGIDWVGLIGEPGTQKFYEKFGFKLMPEYLPMCLEE